MIYNLLLQCSAEGYQLVIKLNKRIYTNELYGLRTATYAQIANLVHDNSSFGVDGCFAYVDTYQRLEGEFQVYVVNVKPDEKALMHKIIRSIELADSQRQFIGDSDTAQDHQKLYFHIGHTNLLDGGWVKINYLKPFYSAIYNLADDDLRQLQSELDNLVKFCAPESIKHVNLNNDNFTYQDKYGMWRTVWSRLHQVAVIDKGYTKELRNLSKPEQSFIILALALINSYLDKDSVFKSTLSSAASLT